jgi:hypothetical protein
MMIEVLMLSRTYCAARVRQAVEETLALGSDGRRQTRVAALAN